MKHTFIYPRDRAMLERALGLIDKPHRIELKPYRHSRSLEQNSLLHVWLDELSKKYQESYGEFYSVEVWKQFFKKRYLVAAHIEVQGEVTPIEAKTSDLDIEEFSHFLTDVDQFCAEELGILLSHPSEYKRAMGNE